MPTNLDRTEVLAFFEHARATGVDTSNPASLAQALAYYESEYVRAGNPFGPRTSKGKIYDQGPWTWYSNDIISDIVQGGSPLQRWLPTRAVTYKNETVSHFSWVAPDGWDGQNYGDFLEAVVIGDCDYGPTPKWEACQYNCQFGTMSASSDTFKFEDFAPQLEYEKSPIFRVRGPNAGLSMQNDAEFGVAQAALMFEQHLVWNLAHGRLGHPLQSDGIAEVIRNDYVSDHKVGDGACDWTDPIVIDGSMLATNKDLLVLIRNLVRHIRSRAAQRNMSIGAQDMVIVMPAAMWAVLADEIPVGALYPAPTTLLNGGNTVQTAEAYRASLMNGGLGYGFLPLDGVNVPVLPGDEFGTNVNSNTQITSDIFILTRRAGGMTLLEQQYLDYGALTRNVPDKQFTVNTAQGGIMRYGWLKYNEACYKWFIESGNRLVSYFQPLQARITSVTVNAPNPFIIEAATYTDAFYANMGVPGSLGAGV